MRSNYQDRSVLGTRLLPFHSTYEPHTHEHEPEDDADDVPEEKPPACEGSSVHLRLVEARQAQHGERAGADDADEGDEEADGEESDTQHTHLDNLPTVGVSGEAQLAPQ